MPTTLEKRLDDLRKKISKPSDVAEPRSNKNWQNTFGFSRDDEGFDDLLQKGREYRKALSKK